VIVKHNIKPEAIWFEKGIGVAIFSRTTALIAILARFPATIIC
jgi:hypothetical protein